MCVSALAFAGHNAFAVLSYQGGGTLLTLLTARMVFALIILAIFMKLSGLVITLPRKQRYAALGLGFMNAIMAFALMSSFDYVAVGMAILVFYLYPVFTGIGAWITGQEKLDRGLIVGVVGGFLGLALALRITGETTNAIGIALAAFASLIMAAIALMSARILKTDNARSVTLHMQVSGVVLFLTISTIAGHVDFAETTSGWIGFAGVLACYTIAVSSFFAGIAHIGAVRASLVMNLEPIATITLGFVVLGQVLTPRQLAGAAVVIAAVTAIKWLGRTSGRDDISGVRVTRTLN